MHVCQVVYNDISKKLTIKNSIMEQYNVLHYHLTYIEPTNTVDTQFDNHF